LTRLLTLAPEGLHCPAGGFFIDPWRPVERALITHAHGDHARPGSVAYLGSEAGRTVLAARLPPDATLQTVRYGEHLRIGEVDVSFHPAGHVLGSAQIRIEHRGEVVVVSGDFKLAPDPTCDAFEPLRCDTYVTESTFGLPVYRWDPPAVTLDAIARWWNDNRATGRASLLFAYAFGKAQRILVGLAQIGGALPGPIYCHGAVENLNAAYRAAGVALPSTLRVADAPRGTRWSDALILAPPSARGSRWCLRFAPYASAFASGWMAIRGTRRRASLDRGFALSDHADWPALNTAIAASEAQEIWVTHGYRDELVRWLGEQGMNARSVDTRFEGETAEMATPTDASPARESAADQSA